MKKHFKVLGITISGALLLGALIGVNTKRIYRAGDYVPEDDAYFVEKIDDPAGLVKAHKLVTPTDDKYSDQKTRSLGSGLIGDIESVWSSYTGKGTTIAIIDDGFDTCHPEYKRADGTSAILSTSRYYYESGSSAYYKEYSSDPSCIAEDWEEDEEYGDAWATHGTNTSTTAAAPMNNGGGVGIAPEADILALKIDFSFSAIKAAINYAVAQKVDVINMSLGAYAESFTDGWGEQQTGYSSSATYLNSACQSAYNAGIIVVAAAGNEATWHKSYPACNTKVVAVGAIGDYDNKGNATELAEFTNYVGSSQTGEINVDILAPGYVYTATQSGTSSKSHTHVYEDTQGTSFSCPIVAGAACLWKQKYPNGTPDEFLSKLQSSADGIGTYKNKMIPVSGWYSSLSDVGPSNIENGRLNVANLLDISDPYVTTKQSSLSISVTEKKQIELATYNGTISYKSNNESVATVSSTGLVQGVAAGTTSVTVTATKDSKTATATVNVTVAAAVATTSATFSPDSVTLNVGDTYDSEQTIVVTPTNASRIFLFESNDESIATVNEDTGLVTAIGAGTTTIQMISGYGTGEDELTVTVQAASLKTGTINFGSGTGRLNVNSTSVTGTDDAKNSWTVTTSGTSNFTPNESYSQIGSSKSPASSIKFQMTLSKSTKISDVSASLGGFTGTAGTVKISVGSTQIGSGSLSGTDDVDVTSTSSASGTTLSIDITSISKGVKAYSITYKYASTEVDPTVTSVSVNPSTLALSFSGTTSSTLTATVTGTGSPAQTVTWQSSDSTVATVTSAGVVNAVAAGSTTITATSTVDTTKSGTCTVTVTDPVSKIEASCSKEFHPGETITKSDISLVKTFASGKTENISDFTFANDGYKFLYSDTNSGSTVKSKQFSVKYSGNTYDFSVEVSRIAYSTPLTSTTLSSKEFDESTLSKKSSTASSSPVTIGGIKFNVTSNAYAYYISNTYYLSFGKTAGSISNAEPFAADLTAFSVLLKSGGRTDSVLTVSKDGTNWVSTSKLSEGGYRYIKCEFIGTGSGSGSKLYSNIETISFTLDGADTPVNVSNYIMYEDTANQCTTKFSEAVEMLNTMSTSDKTTFWTSTDYVISTARERLEAWGRHEGKELSLTDGSFVTEVKSTSSLTTNLIENSSTTIIVIICVVSCVSLCGLVILKRRKQQ